MKRLAAVVAFAWPIMAGACFAQMGGMGGGMGGMGGMGQGMGGMGGMMGGGPGALQVRRAVRVEMEGGRHLAGKLQLANLVVYGDLGQYAIRPEQIKMIRFLKPPSEPGDDGDEKAAAVNQLGRAQLRRAALNQGNGGGMATVRAKVVLDSGEEVIGTIPYGAGFRLVVRYGTIVLAMDKLRVITFEEAPGKAEPAGDEAEGGAPRAAAGDRGGPAAPPQFFRNGPCLVVRSPSGDRVALHNIETGRSIELSGPGDGPIAVTPLHGQDLMALALQGAKINRIAVADTATGWHVQELRRPVEGRMVPTVFQHVVVYVAGRYAYAYSAEAHRWDVAELPRSLEASPEIGPDSATIAGDGHIFTFSAQAGKWEHADLRAILEAAGAGKK